MQRRAFLGAVFGRSAPPNILFLLSDDQRADLLGCAGHRVLRTPEIDKLARGGVRFTNNFCATAICCTSRASIFTGLHEKSHRISNFATRLSPDLVGLSYPELLRRAGYRTGFVGKYGVGGDGAPAELFDVSHGNPGLERVGQSREFARQAVDFLDGVKAGQPFCLSVSFRAPHARDADPKQYLYDPEEAGLYGDVTVPVPRKAAPEYFERLPQYLRESESRARWKLRFTSAEQYQESVKSYFRLIAGVDVAVGNILERLSARGLDQNTIVVYSSDNGYFLGERGLADKWYLYEESIRTPLIVYDPRARRRGVVRGEMTLNVDLAPTMLEWAGVERPGAMQGRSLVPLLAGQKTEWRREWFYSHLFPGVPPRVVIPRSEGVRTTRYKYIRWVDAKPVDEECYDLRRDPEELTPVADERLRGRMRERWRVWNEAVTGWTPGATWRDPENAKGLP
jgi:arylsulfatase A-like enzyme